MHVRISRARPVGALGALVVAASVAAPGALAQEVLDEAACNDLAGATIEADAFGIASGPARVESATMMAATEETARETGASVPAQPDYCQVLGAIAPVGDAPDIRFQVNLPVEWNGKVVQYGGGGFNGVLITGLAPLRDAPPTTPTPLMQGYVTAGTDSGHQNEELPEIQAFALNEEALVNFAHASYKKVRDLTVALAERAYEQEPERYYFFGGSEGGREGLVMAQRYPEYFDGIVSAVPVINWVGLMSAFTQHGQLQLDDGWLSPEAVETIARGVAAACDDLDGLEDGVVNNPEACADVFEIETLLCTEGANVPCLNEAQVEAARAVRQPLEFGSALANGLEAYPAWSFGGENQDNGMSRWMGGQMPPSFPSNPEQSVQWVYGNGMVRYFLAQDPEYDPRQYTIGDFEERALEISELMDGTDPDLSAFAERGGRLILKENMADYAQSPFSTINYHASVVEEMGEEAVTEFVRLYVTPGANHSGRISSVDGEPMPSFVDLLAVLDAWVDEGDAPNEPLTLTLHEETAPYDVLATRPLCTHPEYPHYNGDDPQDAASFECRAP
jgi:hypothetical protein